MSYYQKKNKKTNTYLDHHHCI